MRLAQIIDGLVVNIIEVDPQAVPDWAQGWPETGNAGPGWSFEEGQFVPPGVVLPSLDEVRATARAQVLQAVTAVRAAMITDLPGQQMIYMAKEAEARAYVQDPDPDPSDYPLISAEVGLTAPTAADLAALWLQMAVQWRAVAALLEGARFTVLAAIAAAETAEEVIAATEQALGQLETLTTQ